MKLYILWSSYRDEDDCTPRIFLKTSKATWFTTILSAPPVFGWLHKPNVMRSGSFVMTQNLQTFKLHRGARNSWSIPARCQEPFKNLPCLVFMNFSFLEHTKNGWLFIKWPVNLGRLFTNLPAQLPLHVYWNLKWRLDHFIEATVTPEGWGIFCKKATFQPWKTGWVNLKTSSFRVAVC